MLNKIIIPKDYDYIGVYLIDKCHLNCKYCITQHYNSGFGNFKYEKLKPKEWILGLNRLILPIDTPITLQGGEPFLYKGIWEILDNVKHKIDIMTALPSFLKKQDFLNLKTLDWNKRHALYPTIRVSYHKGQNNYKELILKIAELKEILSIGLYYLDHPDQKEELKDLKKYAEKYKVELRKKEFLGILNGQMYGEYLYKDAVSGKKKNIKVKCKNTVVPISPDGFIYKCHSDLYFNRNKLAIANILDKEFNFPKEHLDCNYYGLCSECDIKIKTNRYQQYGYTSVNISF